jgi:protein tyrosine/serine phosphatase
MYQIKTPWQRIKAYLSAWFIDHEVLRIIYRNFFPLGKEPHQAYRSNHPSPRFIKKLKDQYGIQTIINLRGANQTGQYMLEKEACEKYGVTLVDSPFSSRNAPPIESIHKLFHLFDTVQYPILLHCKSGADRAGIGSVLYEFHKEHIPLEDSKQLSLKYGHIKNSETGILDAFIQNWAQFHHQNPEVKFIDWVDHVYDPEALNKSFKAGRLGNILVNKILRRE